TMSMKQKQIVQFFFFSSRRRHTRLQGDWSSDVCSSDLGLGLDSGVFRNVAAVIMLAIGLVMIVPRLQAGFAVAAGPVGNWAEQRSEERRVGKECRDRGLTDH